MREFIKRKTQEKIESAAISAEEWERVKAGIKEIEEGKFKVDPDKMKQGVRALARDLLVLQGAGNYENASKFIAKYGQMNELLTKTIDKLQDIPGDIKPIFK